MKRLTVGLAAFAILAIGTVLGLFAAPSNPQVTEQAEAAGPSSWIHIGRQRPFLIVPHESWADSTAEWNAFVETQRQLFHSPMVLAKVAASLPELQAEEPTVEWLSDRLQVTQVGKSELFQISFRRQDPRQAVAIVNAIVHEYFLLSAEVARQSSQSIMVILQAEAENREKALSRSYENMEAVTEDDVSEETEARIAQLRLAVEEEIFQALDRRIANLALEQRAPDRVRLLAAARSPLE